MRQYFNKENNIVKLLNDYKEKLDFKSEEYENIEAIINDKPIVISIKIDGILNACQFLDGKSLFATREGRITEELPVLTEISKFLNGKQETILFGELYGIDADGKELPLNETISITRKPESPEDEQRIKFAVFDIYKYDGKLVEESDYWKRILLVQELFENGKLVHPVYAKQEDGSSSIQKLWKEEVLGKGHEGIVLHIEGDTIKIKPTKTVDALVIAIKPNYEKGFTSSLFLALMDKDGIYRSTSFVGTGLKEKERVELFQWANENKTTAPNHDELIWIDINKNPKIVEVDYERPIVKETESFEFKNGEWRQLEENRLSATLIKPRLIRLRDDKKVNKNDLRLIQIPDLEKELTKKLFKVNADLQSFEDWYISKYDELPKYEYVYMHRIEKDGDLYIGFNDIVTGSTRLSKFKFDINKYKDRIVNIDKLLSDMEKVNEIGYDKISILKPSGEVKLFDKKSFKIEAYYPKHPNTVIFPKNEFLRKSLTEADIYNYYEKVKDKIIQQTKNKPTLLYIRVNGDILKRKHDGLVYINNRSDFQKYNNGRVIEFHVEPDEITSTGWVDLDPRESFPWKKTKELTKKIASYFKKLSEVKDVYCRFSGNRGFHIFIKLQDYVHNSQLESYIYGK